MKKGDISLYIALLLLLAGLYFLWPASKPRGNSSHSSGSPHLSTQTPSQIQAIKRKIDQHLKAGRFSEELRRELTAIENEMKAPGIDPSQIDPRVYVPDEPIPIRLQGEKPPGQSAEDAENQKFYNRYHALTPDQRITRKINLDQWERQREKDFEEAFLRQYLENARAAGFDVRLNEKGEIVEVVEIGTDEPIRFPQSVDDRVKKATPQSSH